MKPLIFLAEVLLVGCAGIPEGVSAIQGFEVRR
jgi:hypothetical protein